MLLKTKLFWVVFIAVVLGIGALHGVLSWIGSIFDDGYTPLEIEQAAVALREEAERQANESLAGLLARWGEEWPGLRADWHDREGALVASSRPDAPMERLGDLLAVLSNKPGNRDNLAMTFQLSLRGSEGYLTVAALPGYAQSQYVIIYFEHLPVFFIYLIPVTLFLFAPAVAAVLLTVSITRRLGKLNYAMQTTDLTHQSAMAKDKSKDEIGQITRLFGEMSDKIRGQFEHIQQVETQRKKLVTQLSHNLRTPLTSIIGYADQLNRMQHRNEEERRLWGSIILGRAIYMERLLKQLFQLSLNERSELSPAKRPVDLLEWAREIAAFYIPIWKEKRLAADIRIPDGKLEVRLDAAQMEQAVRNLIENAISYGAEGGYIGFFVTTQEKGVSITVADRGPGIPLDEQEKVFERFYRSTGVDRVVGGLGLGLAFVAETAAAHGGAIRLNSAYDDLTTFTIELPV